MQREWIVSAAADGERLDQHLAQVLGISRARARRAIETGKVQLGARRRPQKGERVQKGLRLLVQWGEEGHAVPRPDLPLQLLAAGEGWLAVDKPSGCGVHPLRPEQRDTVLNAALARWPELSAVGEGGLRGGIVHRLDVQTSGVLLLARDELRFQSLRSAFREHRVEKRYLALVEGNLATAVEVDLDLYIAQRHPARVGVSERPHATARGRRRCRTLLQPLERRGVHTLVEARPVSGYLHQIRISLAHLGHPIVGDAIYGTAGQRLLLHAWHIAIPELAIAAESPPPAELMPPR